MLCFDIYLKTNLDDKYINWEKYDAKFRSVTYTSSFVKITIHFYSDHNYGW